MKKIIFFLLIALCFNSKAQIYKYSHYPMAFNYVKPDTNHIIGCGLGFNSKLFYNLFGYYQLPNNQKISISYMDEFIHKESKFFSIAYSKVNNNFEKGIVLSKGQVAFQDYINSSSIFDYYYVDGNRLDFSSFLSFNHSDYVGVSARLDLSYTRYTEWNKKNTSPDGLFEKLEAKSKYFYLFAEPTIYLKKPGDFTIMLYYTGFFAPIKQLKPFFPIVKGILGLSMSYNINRNKW